MPNKPIKSTKKSTVKASSRVTSERITNLRGTIAKELTKQLYHDIEFSFFAPLSKDVRLAGTFTEWDKNAVKLRPSRTGAWKTKIKLKPGRYEFRYLIDGHWENAQDAMEMVRNEHGSMNCVLTVE